MLCPKVATAQSLARKKCMIVERSFDGSILVIVQFSVAHLNWPRHVEKSLCLHPLAMNFASGSGFGMPSMCDVYLGYNGIR